VGREAEQERLIVEARLLASSPEVVFEELTRTKSGSFKTESWCAACEDRRHRRNGPSCSQGAAARCPARACAGHEFKMAIGARGGAFRRMEKTSGLDRDRAGSAAVRIADNCRAGTPLVCEPNRKKASVVVVDFRPPEDTSPVVPTTTRDCII
jgi:hypothetical protein